jgi:hypothetical protein
MFHNCDKFFDVGKKPEDCVFRKVTFLKKKMVLDSKARVICESQGRRLNLETGWETEYIWEVIMSEYALQVRVVLAALNSQECYCLH